MAKRVLLVAGDPSGDHHAALLAAELQARAPEVELYAVGGPHLQAAGVPVIEDLTRYSAIGLADVLPGWAGARRLFGRLVRRLRADPPDAAVLLDCGAFNLPLSRVLKDLGVPVLGYFPPGSWSGSLKRASAVAGSYSAVATPFPQALPAYAQLGLPAVLVGHPLVDEMAPVAAARASLAGPPVLAILPGSRRQEILHILPPMLGAAALLRAKLPELRVVVSRAASVSRRLFDGQVERAGVPLEVVAGSIDALRPATAALVKSGTITLEAMLLGVPMVVAYRASHLAYAVAALYYWPRPKYWAMPNILANDLVVPQLFQYRVTAPRLADEVQPLLSDSPERRQMTERLQATAARLGGPGASARTAEMLLSLLRRRSTDDPDERRMPASG